LKEEPGYKPGSSLFWKPALVGFDKSVLRVANAFFVRGAALKATDVSTHRTASAERAVMALVGVLVRWGY
jgi:hypothetical protein